MAEARRRELDIPRDEAAARRGCYVAASGRRVDWREAVQAARARKVSIPPCALLPHRHGVVLAETRVQVSNETTPGAARRLVEGGLKPLALNFANGIHPGGGFLSGARAQEEALCRCSALDETLVGDPMYDAHRQRPRHHLADRVIHSPDVPGCRSDDGTALEFYWLPSVVTCAAPYAPTIGRPRLETSCGAGLIACSPSPETAATLHWCSAPGAAGPSATTRAGRRPISGAR